MMSIPSLALTLIFSLSGISSAKIGETIDEAVARYGKPITSKERDGETIVFWTLNGVTIDAHFEGGRCVLIQYKAEGPMISGGRGQNSIFSKEDAHSLARLNLGEPKKIAKTSEFEEEWEGEFESQDGTVIARVFSIFVYIQTKSSIAEDAERNGPASRSKTIEKITKP